MNIVGEGIPDFVSRQILARQKIHGSGYIQSRSPMELMYLNGNTSWCKLVSGADVNDSNALAKEYVLFNGTTPNGIGIKSINDAYNIAKDEFGFRPMPGITSAIINHENRGSLKRAEVKIKCFNIEQFRILDLLYLRLGYNILLEWGHSMYYTETLNQKKQLVKAINGIGSSLSEEFLKGEVNYDEFLLKIIAQRRITHGNYDAMFARVENFSWVFNKDGSYDITLKLISIGDVIESLKVNVSLPTSIMAPTTSPSENLTSAAVVRNYAPANSIGAWLANGVPTIDQEAAVEEYNKFQDPIYLRTNLPPSITLGAGSTLSPISPTYTISLPGSPLSSPTPLDSSNSNFKLPFDLIDPITKQPLDPATNKPYANPAQSQNYNLISNPTFAQISFASDIGTQYYVRLGDFLSFLQNGDSDKSSIIPKVFAKGKNKGVPLIKFDLNEDQNLIYTDPAQISINPLVCFVKRNININGTVYSYTDDNNSMIDFTTEIDGIVYGKILNVYVNSVFIIDTIQQNTNKLGELDIYTFLDKIVKSINSSLGGFNDLMIVMDENSTKVTIIDKNPLPNRDKILKKFNRSISTAEFLLYGYSDNQASFVKDFNFKTELSPSLATTVVVASQNQGVVIGIDGTGFSNLNKNLSDRFKEKITNDISTTDELRTNVEKLTTVKDRWGEYKNFLISLSTDSASGYKTPTCATKSNCSTYRTTLKDLIKLNASFKDIKIPPPPPVVTKRIPIYEGNEIIGYDNEQLNTNPNTYLTNAINAQNELRVLNRETSVGNPSPTSGFLPFNLSLSVTGLSGMGMYQKFTIDTRYLPSNYPSTTEFLIKNIKHEISNQQWTTQLESFAITKYVGSTQKLSQDYLSDLTAQSVYVPNKAFVVHNVSENKSIPIQSSTPNTENKNLFLDLDATTPKTSEYLFGGPISQIKTASGKPAIIPQSSAHGARPGVSTGWASTNAWDIHVAPRTPVYAVTGGTVFSVYWGVQLPFIWGWQVLTGISQKQAFYTHLDHVVVAPNQSIKKGDLIGFVGIFAGHTPSDNFHHLHLGLYWIKSGNYNSAILRDFVDINGKIL